MSTYGQKKIVQRYVRSLFDLSVEDNCIEEVINDLKDLSEMLDTIPIFKTIVYKPVLGQNEQRIVMNKILEKCAFNQLVSNFIKLLVENKRLPILGDVIEHFFIELLGYKKESKVGVVSATELTQKEKQSLVASMSKILNEKILFDYEVDPRLISGFKLFINDNYLIDCTVATKMNNLLNFMKGQV